MRLLLLFLLGLAVGAVGTDMIEKALQRKSAFPDGVMTVMGHQMKALGESLKQNRCTTSDLTARLQTLRLVANDIEPAFGGLQKDEQFGRYAGGLRGAADLALASPMTSCAVATAAVNKVDQACDSCHRDYRN